MTASRNEIQFEWDPGKARGNQSKHRMSFVEASEVFLDPLALSRPDEEHGRQEERWATMGRLRSGRLVVVVHTYTEVSSNQVRVRMISARRATRSEARQFQEGS